MAKSKVLLFVLLFMLAALVAGCAPATPSTAPQGSEADKTQTSPPVAPSAETMRLTVYYATPDAMYLAPEVRVVPKTDRPAQNAVELLLQDPKSHDLLRVMPDGTKVKGLTVKDHVAYVDFNDKLAKGSSGSTTEMLIVASVVNTLTEFPDIHKVQIMVEGKKVDTLSGHMDLSEPLSRSEKIIRKSL